MADLMEAPIGVFDSGVGGLSVVRALRAQLPQQDVIFLGDQAHVPYGQRSLEEVRIFSEAITRFLMEQGARLVIVACNAASAAALHYLRQVFPQTPFVGMEPAVKPAAEQTHSGVVGVLATPATFQGELYASVVERFAQNVNLLQDTCPGLVGQIEAGELDTPATRLILEKALLPMLEKGIDTIVLGCTHYPFVIPLIEQIAGPQVRVIDPAPAVARQAGRLLGEKQGTRERGEGILRVLTSGEPAALERLLPRLIGESRPVEGVQWSGSQIRAAGRKPALCLLGAIAGDIIGSRFEFHPHKSTEFELFAPNCKFTDDSVLTLAVADAITSGRSYVECIQAYALKYPGRGYGGYFSRWIHTPNPQPYHSYGNGSAMRVSAVGWAFNNLEEVLLQAEASAAVTHNHPEGIKGAQAVALAIFRARTGASKGEIHQEISQRFGYDLTSTLDAIRPAYRFDETCQKTVPQAILAFLESEDFEDAIRKAVSLGGDADTLAAITGSIAEAYYQEVPAEIAQEVKSRLSRELWEVIERFNAKCRT